jgi:DNA-binding transcriptional LysR family regulator
MMDRLLAMRQFATVVETGSFSSAAKRLNMGQPAVSKAIANLEDYLGVRLLVRTTRAQHLTDSGARYFERIRLVLDEADEAEAAARAEASSLVGQLRIALPTTYGALHVIPRLGEFLAAHPGLAIDLVLDDRRIDLTQEGIDLAIRTGALDDSNLVARKLGSSPRLIVGSAAYLERYGAPADPSALAEHRMISMALPGHFSAIDFTKGAETVSVSISGALRVSAAEALRSCIIAGLGLGMITRMMLWPELRSGAVRQVLPDWGLPATDIWALFPAGRRPTARARAFADWLGGVLAPDGTLRDKVSAE